MTAMHAILRKGRYHIVRNRWGGYNVIDSTQERPISLVLGGSPNPLDMWAIIKRAAA